MGALTAQLFWIYETIKRREERGWRHLLHFTGRLKCSSEEKSFCSGDKRRNVKLQLLFYLWNMKCTSQLCPKSGWRAICGTLSEISGPWLLLLITSSTAENDSFPFWHDIHHFEDVVFKSGHWHQKDSNTIDLMNHCGKPVWRSEVGLADEKTRKKRKMFGKMRKIGRRTKKWRMTGRWKDSRRPNNFLASPLALLDRESVNITELLLTSVTLSEAVSRFRIFAVGSR